MDGKPPINTDLVNHPNHYTSTGIRCPKCGNEIEVINITKVFSFVVGNILKYVLRALKKNGLEDMKKARWYLNYWIEEEEQKSPGEHDGKNESQQAS